MSARVSGYLSVAAGAFLWSFGGLFVKILVKDYQADPWAVACLRSVVAGVVLAWALPRIGRVRKWRVAAAGLAFTPVVSAFVLATAMTTAANAVFLQYTYPLFVAVGAVWFFSERLGRRAVAALALGMAGVAVIFICSWTPGDRAGVAIGAGSAVAFAAFALMQRSIRHGNPIALSSIYNLMAGALLLPLAIGSLNLSLEAFLVTAAMGVFQLGLPYVLVIRGLQRVPATDVALITLIEPVANPLWVWLCGYERPATSTLLGGALILLALAVRFSGMRRPGERRP